MILFETPLATFVFVSYCTWCYCTMLQPGLFWKLGGVSGVRNRALSLADPTAVNLCSLGSATQCVGIYQPVICGKMLAYATRACINGLYKVSMLVYAIFTSHNTSKCWYISNNPAVDTLSSISTYKYKFFEDRNNLLPSKK